MHKYLIFSVKVAGAIIGGSSQTRNYSSLLWTVDFKQIKCFYHYASQCLQIATCTML